MFNSKFFQVINQTSALGRNKVFDAFFLQGGGYFYGARFYAAGIQFRQNLENNRFYFFRHIFFPYLKSINFFLFLLCFAC